ncbi:MAG TPA: hypothetical protein VF807_09685 [Ktedonobacterales bacterium]
MTFFFGLRTWPESPNDDYTLYQTSLQKNDAEVWQWWDGSPIDWATLVDIPFPDDLGFQASWNVSYSLAAIKLENAIENLTEHLGDPLSRRFSGANIIDILPFKPGELHNTRYDVLQPDGTARSISTTSYWMFWYEQYRSQGFRERVQMEFRSEPNRDLELADTEWWTGYLETLIRAGERYRLPFRIIW